MELMFYERFNNPALPRWVHRGLDYRSDSEWARGDPRAVKVRDGQLHLLTMKDPENDGFYLNGHIGTEGKYDFIYGVATARMRVHPYHGTHAAFWLQSYGPYRPGYPEIDIAECFGLHIPDRKSGANMWHNLYYRDDTESPILSAREQTNSVEFAGAGESWYERFHDYSVEWTPNSYVFSIDGKQTATITKGLSSTPKYLVLSMLTRDFEVNNMAEHPIETYDTAVKWVKVWQ